LTHTAAAAAAAAGTAAGAPANVTQPTAGAMTCCHEHLMMPFDVWHCMDLHAPNAPSCRHVTAVSCVSTNGVSLKFYGIAACSYFRNTTKQNHLCTHQKGQTHWVGWQAWSNPSTPDPGSKPL
jgi:hypothetical protein